jgi:hypothetical protein
MSPVYEKYSGGLKPITDTLSGRACYRILKTIKEWHETHRCGKNGA